MSYNHLCPVCQGPIHISHISAHCEIPIRSNGWAVMVTQKNSGGSESFTCPKCQCTVPAGWVYKGDRDIAITEKEAVSLMKRWGAGKENSNGKEKDDRSDPGVPADGEVPGETPARSKPRRKRR